MRNLIVFTVMLTVVILGSTALAEQTLTSPVTVDGTANPAILKLGVDAVSDGAIDAPHSLFINIDSNNNSSNNEGFYVGKDGEGRSGVVSGDGGVPLFAVMEYGRVGIRTVNPVSSLHVSGENPSALTLGLAEAYDGAINTPHSLFINIDSNNNSSNEGFYVGMDGAARTGVVEGGVPLFTVRETGNVGIGIISPSAKLHVVGNIVADNITVLENAVTALQSLLGSVATNPSVSQRVNDNADAIQDIQQMIDGNEDSNLVLESELAAAKQELQGLIDAKADTTALDEVIADLEQEVNDRTTAINDLRTELGLLIGANTALINQNSADIALNLSYIKYIETALSAPGASGISRYERITTP